MKEHGNKKYNPDFINEAFKTYKERGDISPLLQDLKCLTYHFAKAYNIEHEFFEGDLFLGISERTLIAIQHFDKTRKTKPFSFFYGMVSKHVMQEAVRLSRLAQKTTSFTEAMYLSSDDDKAEGRGEIYCFIENLKNRISTKKASEFLNEIKMAIIDGENILKVKDRVLKRGKQRYAKITQEEIDWVIIKLRLKLWTSKV